MQIKPTKRAASAAAAAARFVAICIPGRSDDDLGSWYVYDREMMASRACADRAAALRQAAQLNARGSN